MADFGRYGNEAKLHHRTTGDLRAHAGLAHENEAPDESDRLFSEVAGSCQRVRSKVHGGGQYGGTGGIGGGCDDGQGFGSTRLQVGRPKGVWCKGNT